MQFPSAARVLGWLVQNKKFWFKGPILKRQQTHPYCRIFDDWYTCSDNIYQRPAIQLRDYLNDNCVLVKQFGPYIEGYPTFLVYNIGYNYYLVIHMNQDDAGFVHQYSIFKGEFWRKQRNESRVAAGR